MANGKPPRRSIFSGLLLILIGALILWHNFRGGFLLWDLLHRWWPVLLIIWGVAKLVDHFAAQRSGQTGPRTITGGEVFLVILVVLLVSGVGGADWLRQHGDMGDFPWPPGTSPHEFSEELPARQIPADATIDIRTGRGDITVHTEEASELRVLVKKVVNGMSDSEAEKRAGQTKVTITESSGGYSIQPENWNSRTEVNLEVHVPKRASVTALTERGNVQILGVAGNVVTHAPRGDIEIRDTGGDVNAETTKGDVHIVGAGGNVKLAGRGGQIELANIKGEAVVEGEFFGPIRIEKVAKGLRFVSSRTDFSLSQLAGRIEIGSGKWEVTDAPGNVNMVTRKNDVTLDNVAGRVHIEDRDGNIELRFAQPPREPIEVSTESGTIELVLPAKSAFEIHAESRSGEIDCSFDSDLAKQAVENKGTTRLDGKFGAKGPQIRLKTSYGTINIRKGE